MTSRARHGWGSRLQRLCSLAKRSRLILVVCTAMPALSPTDVISTVLPASDAQRPPATLTVLLLRRGRVYFHNSSFAQYLASRRYHMRCNTAATCNTLCRRMGIARKRAHVRLADIRTSVRSHDRLRWCRSLRRCMAARHTRLATASRLLLDCASHVCFLAAAAVLVLSPVYRHYVPADGMFQ